MLNIKTHVRALYEVKASSECAIYVNYFPLTSSLKHLLDLCVELLIYRMVLSELLVKNPLTGKGNNQPALLGLT